MRAPPVVCLVLGGTGLLAACGRLPPPSAPGAGSLWGYVRLVPREGVVPGRKDGGPYADRRLRDVEFVDYHKPGFVVVYADGPPVASAATTVLTVGPSGRGGRLGPPYAAVAMGGTVVVRNTDERPHTVSCPSGNVVQRLVPGAELRLAATRSGPLSVYLLDGTAGTAVVFAAPGPFAIATEDGRWELRDVPPGQQQLHAWHSRFPGADEEVDVPVGRATRVDLQIGVGNLHTHEHPHEADR